MPITSNNGGTMVTGEAINFLRLLSLRQGLKLEMQGMRLCRGRTCYAIVKSEFGFKGNKQKVYEQLVDYIQKNKDMAGR